jgi:MFS transporter, DHA2 family, multidrug resistance protein
MATSTTARDGLAPQATAIAAAAPLSGGALVLGTIALSLATFMNVLDTSIANVSIPAIAGDLGVSPSQGTWVITSFAVANAISLPLTGWLTQRYGQVRLFTASVLLFVIASILCAIAPSIELLILFRVIQGAVAGPMIPLSQSLLLSSYPKKSAGTALAMWAITTLVAPVVGPLLGGWITDNISWPWIFYINVPVGIGAAAVTWMIYRKRETATVKLPIDTVGLALLVVWVGALQIMLDKGKDLDWFHSGQVVALAIAAVVGFSFFLVWELTDRHPVVDLRLFARRNFWTASLAMSLAYGTFFGNVVLLPLWLQQYMGYNATQAGMVLAPVGVLAILLTPLVGKNINKVDPRVFATGAFAVFALVLFMRSQFNTDVNFGTLLIPTVIQGAAMAVFFIPLITLALSGLTPDRIPAASGLFNFTRITAGSFGTSIATTLWDRRASLHHAQLADHVTNFDPSTAQALAGMRAGGMSPQQSYDSLNRILDQQAFMLSANDIFYASALVFLLLIAVVWLARPVKGGQADSSASAAH